MNDLAGAMTGGTGAGGSADAGPMSIASAAPLGRVTISEAAPARHR
jgi:hypothetical protein